MWVYPKTETRFIAKPSSASADLPAIPEQIIPSAAPPRPPAVNAASASASPKQKRMPHLNRGCTLLAAAYLLGTFAAGILQARCDAGEAEMLAYYLQCWQSLFAIQSVSQVARLFTSELLTALGALTVLLLLGLSALGALPIYLFAMLYGAGMGLLSAQLLSGLGWKRFLLMGLCLFGAAALRVSSRLHAVSFGQAGKSRGATPGARRLLGQFAWACGAFLPLCGGAVCLAYLANHLG